LKQSDNLKKKKHPKYLPGVNRNTLWLSTLDYN